MDLPLRIRIIHFFCHSGLDPESSYLNGFWMPDQVRHDDVEAFYKTFKISIS